MQAGDSLYKIGEEYGVDYKKIARDNEIPLNKTLVIGQTIVIKDVDVTNKLGDIEVNGFAFTNIKDELIRKALPYLSYLSIFSYQVSSDGAIKGLNDDPLISLAKSNKVQPMMVITNIDSSSGKFSSDLAHDLLVNNQAIDKLIANVLEVLKAKGYYGLTIDFEYVYPYDKDVYNSFLDKISRILHQNGYILMTALAPKTAVDQKGTLYEAHDYNFHGKVADRVILMTYEWGYTYGQPQPVAPLPAVEKVIDFALTQIPADKILMGIPNYGYDWKVPYVKGTAASPVGNYTAVSIARNNKASISYDETRQAPYFTYFDADKQEHIVWFEDARSIQAKLQLVDSKMIRGVSYWTLNRAWPQNWLVLDAMFNVLKK